MNSPLVILEGMGVTVSHWPWAANAWATVWWPLWDWTGTDTLHRHRSRQPAPHYSARDGLNHILDGSVSPNDCP